ncbi:hypothetical protein PPGU16_58500 (plasmid) [Paraburkholderia largidicola]|uniref:Uncharacterized protein n=1 Tax=Paraburkholderia largidicola TaxID=3014751 RepID=A0A7I8BW49_9BURK|nr:hypothetical protein PPGU16_58500 [Paraburkholderia sp. PGU16]
MFASPVGTSANLSGWLQRTTHTGLRIHTAEQMNVSRTPMGRPGCGIGSNTMAREARLSD